VVGGAAAEASEEEETTTTTTTTSVSSTLPCQPTVTNVDGVTYYQCGTQYYVEAYGGSGPIFMPVSPPQ
jgi:hypothetical protein